MMEKKLTLLVPSRKIHLTGFNFVGQVPSWSECEFGGPLSICEKDDPMERRLEQGFSVSLSTTFNWKPFISLSTYKVRMLK